MKKVECSFKLPSGVPVVCYELYGDNYEILTSAKHKNDTEKMIEFMLSFMVSVGSVKITPENGKKFIKNMRATDKRHILASVRQASMEFEIEFEFRYKWLDSEGVTQYTDQKVSLNDMESAYTLDHIEQLKKDFGDTPELVKFYTELNKNGTFRTTPSTGHEEEYEDLPTYHELELRKSKVKIRMHYLTSKGELLLSRAGKNKMSTNTLLEARYPQYQNEDDKWVKLNLRECHMLDLMSMEKAMIKHEGKVEMEISFDNPDPQAPLSEKLITKDLIGETPFFFPSGALDS